MHYTIDYYRQAQDRSTCHKRKWKMQIAWLRLKRFFVLSTIMLSATSVLASTTTSFQTEYRFECNLTCLVTSWKSLTQSDGRRLHEKDLRLQRTCNQLNCIATNRYVIRSIPTVPFPMLTTPIHWLLPRPSMNAPRIQTTGRTMRSLFPLSWFRRCYVRSVAARRRRHFVGNCRWTCKQRRVLTAHRCKVLSGVPRRECGRTGCGRRGKQIG